MIAPSTIRTLAASIAQAEKAGETQAALAERLGVSPALISDVKKKRHANVSIARENELRRALGLRELTESGKVRRKRDVLRLYVSAEDRRRLAALGVTAQEALQKGIADLESRRSLSVFLAERERERAMRAMRG